MALVVDEGLSSQEIVELSRRHTLFDWSAQASIDPLPVDHAKGVYFWTTDGRRILDFNSQLMSVNIGHGDPRVIQAVQRQVEKLAYINPFMTHEPRARLGQRLAEILPGDIDKVFFTNGGAEATENAIRIARLYTGRSKILARYRSYHGATAGAIAATGDPRRWAAEPGPPGIIHFLDPHHWGEREPESAEASLRRLEEILLYEGAHSVAAIIVETISGSAGILLPPDGYLEGLRALCDAHGILLITDEVAMGFGRTGKWFAVDHWQVVPDIITMAKGLTSSYIPLGAVGVRRMIGQFFDTHTLNAGLTYNSHPVGCAAALATIRVYEEDDLINRSMTMGEVLRDRLLMLQRRHPSIGSVRSIGLCAVLELVKNRETNEPLVGYNETNQTLRDFGADLLANGLFTFVRWNLILVNPPLIITEAEIDEGIAILDRSLDIVDRAAT